MKFPEIEELLNIGSWEFDVENKSTHQEMQTVLQKSLALPCPHKETVQHYNPTSNGIPKFHNLIDTHNCKRDILSMKLFTSYFDEKVYVRLNYKF